MRFVMTLLGAATLSACGTAGGFKPVSTFDVNAAKRLLAPGSNTIQGSALIRQQGGGIVTCAGEQVFLIPATERAKEWAEYSFGSQQAGYRERSMRGRAFFPDANEMTSTTRQTRCDTAGKWKFDAVADGSFYVLTRINWEVRGEPQGGELAALVTVSAGKVEDIVLAP